MLPDMMDSYLPTKAGKSLMLSSLLAFRDRLLDAASKPDLHAGDIEFMRGEAQQAEDVADWLEDVPTRTTGVG